MARIYHNFGSYCESSMNLSGGEDFVRMVIYQYESIIYLSVMEKVIIGLGEIVYGLVLLLLELLTVICLLSLFIP